ncbi:MAG: hypothetical protein KatS3mg004_1928 [Bryobacteraceae bacterium]|nr:MAG: hypothetical protein KatS3mg004_1928 [Bryobacteraceae bacterium]
MQVLQAGGRHLVRLELDADLLRQAAEEAGFVCQAHTRERSIVLDLVAEDREGPLLLFDGADPGNTGWFARCQFYVDARSGTVMQTPMVLANLRDATGRPNPRAVRIQILTELPLHARLPGRQPVTEKALLAVFVALLRGLVQNGVAVCGRGSLQPLAGRTELARR